MPLPPPPGGGGGGGGGDFENEAGTTMRTKDGLEYVKRRPFEDRYNADNMREKTETHKGVGIVFLGFSLFVLIIVTESIDLINGGFFFGSWGLAEDLGLSGAISYHCFAQTSRFCLLFLLFLD